MKRRSLYRKLYVYFLIVIVLSLASVGFFSYRTSSQELDVLVRNQMTQIVGNAVHHTDSYLKGYERSLVSLLTNREVKEFVDLPGNLEEYEYYRYRKLIREIGVDPLFIRNPEIASIYVISFKGNAVYYFSDVPEQSFSADEVKSQLDYFRAHTNNEGLLGILNNSILSNQKNQMITLVRQIRGLSSPVPQGLLAIEVRSADLSALWKGIDLGANGYFFIMDENGQIVYHPQTDRVGTMVPEPLKHKITASGQQLFEDSDQGEDRVYMARKSDYSGWSLVVSMPKSELRKPVSNIRLTTIVVGLFTLVLALGIAYRFGRSITVPIQVLKNGMRETGKGNWATIPLPEHSDEIVELMMRYNRMVQQLSELVEKVYEAELKNQVIQMERQQAEFQSLQLQINPHFMYNTLETIVCYAVIQDSEEISEIVKSLAYMLRYSVQTNLEEITVANELKHVMYFMVVLHHRIGREFELDVAIKPELLLYQMVRLTLQPLVENVFQHAFPDGVEDYHWIRIDAGETEDGLFWVSVEDNGAGMTASKLAELREKLSANRLADGEADGAGKKGGIGILNVHRRIQMVFGDEYGLQIDSEPERGTRMMMYMPAMDRRKAAIALGA
ncbi:cache domain-containing sensor histidine kinase [Paenibacillus cremeus]|uniref:HAMP domain-containing protein n=1 Tax=Paenibacillus cremeus TaxID=2163881 RepID=A0A559K472_9BACL|nr:cache domain-containing protein [Paenibacillus cremeus]TVY06932.1 HAMP domain-containing protein [Paenibacillus cremeus]